MSYECIHRQVDVEVEIKIFRKMCEYESPKNVNRKIVRRISIIYLPNNVLLEVLFISMLEFMFQIFQRGQI